MNPKTKGLLSFKGVRNLYMTGTYLIILFQNEKKNTHIILRPLMCSIIDSSKRKYIEA